MLKAKAKEKLQMIQNQIETIQTIHNSHQSQTFKLRRMLTNRGDSDQVEAIIDPKSKELILDKEEILRTILEHASCIL